MHVPLLHDDALTFGREEQVHDAHEHRIHPASIEPGQRSHDRADDDHEYGGYQAYGEGYAAAEEQAGQVISAYFVGAQKVCVVLEDRFGSGGLEGRSLVRAVVGKGGDHGHDDDR